MFVERSIDYRSLSIIFIIIDSVIIYYYVFIGIFILNTKMSTQTKIVWPTTTNDRLILLNRMSNAGNARVWKEKLFGTKYVETPFFFFLVLKFRYAKHGSDNGGLW